MASLFWVVTVGNMLLNLLSSQIECKRSCAPVPHNKMPCWFGGFKITLTCSLLFLKLLIAVARAAKAPWSILGCWHKETSVGCGSSEVTVVLLLTKTGSFQSATHARRFVWLDRYSYGLQRGWGWPWCLWRAQSRDFHNDGYHQIGHVGIHGGCESDHVNSKMWRTNQGYT